MTENTQHDHDGGTMPPMRERNVAVMFTDDGSRLSVDHLYPADTGTCPDCGSATVAPGLVGLTLDESAVLLSPEEALILANRLARAADLVLEAGEDLPDADRALALYAAAPAPQAGD